MPPFQSNSPLRAIDATDRPHPLEGQLDGIDDPSQFAAAETRSQDLSVGPAPSTNTLNFCKVAIDGMYKLSTTAKKDDYLALARALNIILSVDTFTSQANRLICLEEITAGVLAKGVDTDNIPTVAQIKDIKGQLTAERNMACTLAPAATRPTATARGAAAAAAQQASLAQVMGPNPSLADTEAGSAQ